MLEEEVITINGQEIKYLKRLNDGPIVLFLPGISGTHKGWTRVIDKLSSRFSVISISLPPYSGDNDLVSLPKLVKGFIDEMDIKKVILVGHSLGGLIALRVSSLYPERVLRVAIVASPLPDIEKRKFIRGIIPRFKEIKNVDKLTRYYGSHEKLINNLARFLDYGQGSEKKMNEEEWNKLVCCIIDIVNHQWIKDIGKVKCPSLIVYGDEDRALVFFGGTELYSKFKDVIILKIGGDHRLPRDKSGELALIINGFACEE
ncbi:MAG: alpha/beta hydrolase [bacterium]